MTVGTGGFVGMRLAAIVVLVVLCAAGCGAGGEGDEVVPVVGPSGCAESVEPDWPGVPVLAEIPSFEDDDVRFSTAEVVRQIGACLYVDYVALEGFGIDDLAELLEGDSSVLGVGYPTPEPIPAVLPLDYVEGEGRASPPGGEFVQVAAGTTTTCGLRGDGTVVCWGDTTEEIVPDGRFRLLSVGNFACGVKLEGGVECWGGRDGPSARGVTDAPAAGDFAQIDVGDVVGCAIDSGQRLHCWGTGALVFGGDPDGFARFTIGLWHRCGLRLDHRVRCWGSNRELQAEPPDALFVDIAGGARHTCGLTTTRTILCWGSNKYGQLDAPAGEFVSLTAGHDSSFTCALDTDHAAHCWGDGIHGDIRPPDVRFAEISAGQYHACGRTDDGTVLCWGSDATRY